MNNRIRNIETQLNTLKEEKDSLQGECKLLNTQILDLEDKIAENQYNEELYKKCTAFLNYIQINSNELVKNSFESIVTEALQFILGEGHIFSLEFKKRGNLGELYFNYASPEKPTPTPMDQNNSGGAIDVISMALRLVILQLTVPKNRGFVFFDEPLKGLRGKTYLENANRFLKFVSEKFQRQNLTISHEAELQTNPDFNLIQIKGEE